VSDPASGDDRRSVPSLRVGHVPGVTTTKWRRIWGERFPRLSLEVLEVPEAEQRRALTDERVDMCFLRQPVSATGPAGDVLHAIPLYEEVPVVVAAKDHPVAVFDAVTLADLSEEDLLDGFALDEALDLAAAGSGVLIVPQSVARTSSRRDLVHRPVTDAEPTRILLAWLRENPHEMIEEWIGIVRGRTVNSSRSTRPSPAPTPAPTAAASTRRAGTSARPGRRPGRPPRRPAGR